MKYLKALTTVVFIIIILIPILTFNFEPHVISEIDNRFLTENPFAEGASASADELLANCKNYISDRIGFRDEMILGYTVLNDRLFGSMLHPAYSYGEDGYIFSGHISTVADGYSEYHEAFADMVKCLQDYCAERGIPFVFVFNPAKSTVLNEHISKGINYDRSWVDQFLKALDDRGIRYVDNTELLKEKTAQGEVVFNQKFDAAHWNDLGAYYGTNSILAELQKDFSAIQLNSIDNFTVSQVHKTSLLVSKFPIDEMVPTIDLHQGEIIAKTDSFKGELELNQSYPGFGYFINPQKVEEGTPRVLVFQGSYLNGLGVKYLTNAFGEYIHVHDYHNVLNLPYYYNIFKPDCVVFEVAEYTFAEKYFSYEKMLQLNMNPPVNVFQGSGFPQISQSLASQQLYTEAGTQLTDIHWDTYSSYDYVWLSLNGEIFDMRLTDTGYEATVSAEKYDGDTKVEIIVFDGASVITYR